MNGVFTLDAPNGIELGTLSISPTQVPEPGTTGMLLSGLMSLGLLVGRKRLRRETESREE